MHLLRQRDQRPHMIRRGFGARRAARRRRSLLAARRLARMMADFDRSVGRFGDPLEEPDRVARLRRVVLLDAREQRAKRVESDIGEVDPLLGPIREPLDELAASSVGVMTPSSKRPITSRLSHNRSLSPFFRFSGGSLSSSTFQRART